MTSTDRPLTTIIVVPREKFSRAIQSLDSIIEHSEHPYELIYVDARSPRRVRDAIAERCRRNGFQHIRVERFLPTNRARNLGLKTATGKYIVFVENDVVVSEGWLGPLVDCAEATGATVVSPLICQGEPIHTYIHCAGGECGIRTYVKKDGTVKRRLFERIAKQRQRLDAVLPMLSRSQTQLAEFHCMMIRKDYLDAHGPLDEQVINTREHVDFCIEVAGNGGTVWLEPGSIVTYLHDSALEASDSGFFMMRWSERWARATMQRLQEKHGLSPDPDGLALRLRIVNWRRRALMIRPAVHRVTRGFGGRLVNRSLEYGFVPFERLAGRMLHAWNDRQASSDKA